jgi:RND family efflux transporter MFP subunit
LAGPAVRGQRSHGWLVVLCLGAMACGGGGGGARTRPPPQVVVKKPTVQDVPVEARAPVDLRPLLVAEITSKQLGYLSAVLVERGDKVRRGQLLALVRPSDLPEQLQAARSALQQAQAQLTLARGNRERVGSLAPSGVVSMQELEQSRSALAQAESQEAAAQAQLAAVATRLGETRIDSPLDGVVLSRRLDPGALVGPMSGTNGALLTVARIDTLKVLVAVREREAADLQIGAEASIEVDARPGQRFSGKAVRLSPGFDPVTRTLEAEVHLPNPDGVLRPGMYGRAALRLGLHPQALVVPEAAVQISGNERFVFVLSGDRVKRRAITVGVDGGTWLEVTKGIAAGDEVVVAGAEMIADGVAVRPVRDAHVYSGKPSAPG